MSHRYLLITSLLILVGITACIPATQQSPTPTVNSGVVTVEMLCGLVEQDGFRLGATNETDARKWIESHQQPKTQPDTLSWSDGRQKLSPGFHEDRMIAASFTPLDMNITFGQVVNGLGEPEMVLGALGWLVCEKGCPYNIDLVYPTLGIWVSSFGVDGNPIRLQDDTWGTALREDMRVTAWDCFIPGQLQAFLDHAFSAPARIDEQHVNRWEGFGAVVPIPP